MSLRVLLVHNRYLIRAGEDQSFDAEVRLLRDHGHQVDEYIEDNLRVSDLGRLRSAVRTTWSQETYRRVRARLRETCPDVVYVQNFFPLISPAVYYAAHGFGVPVVQTLRNYRLICPSAILYRSGRTCEDCVGRRVAWPALVHRCYRDNHAATGAVMTMLAVHKAIGTWERRVDRYVALTEFARDRYIAGGLPAAKIVVRPNFLHPDPGLGEGSGGFQLYVGRLSAEKGVRTLLKALSLIPSGPRVVAVGEGPLESIVGDAASRGMLTLLGPRPNSEVLELIGQAQTLLFPSEWYEGLPRTIVEAFARGTPVIAASLGAMSSLIRPAVTGLHFPPGDPQALAAQMLWAAQHPRAMAAMRHEARREFEASYTAQSAYEQLMEIFAGACRN
jgi:glycosyltransferase involved in cell wall biosynthesis